MFFGASCYQIHFEQLCCLLSSFCLQVCRDASRFSISGFGATFRKRVCLCTCLMYLHVCACTRSCHCALCVSYVQRLRLPPCCMMGEVFTRNRAGTQSARCTGGHFFCILVVIKFLLTPAIAQLVEHLTVDPADIRWSLVRFRVAGFMEPSLSSGVGPRIIIRIKQGGVIAASCGMPIVLEIVCRTRIGGSSVTNRGNLCRPGNGNPRAWCCFTIYFW